MLATLLVACTSMVEHPPATINTKPLEDAAHKVEVAAQKVDDATKKMEQEKSKSLSKAAAAIKGVLIANDKNPDGLPKVTVDKEANVADTGMQSAGVLASPEDLVEMSNRVNLMLSGKIEQAKEFYDRVVSELNEERVARAKAEADRDNAIKDNEIAKNKYKEELMSVKSESAANIRGWELKYEQMEKTKDNDIKRLGQKNASEDFSRNSKALAVLSLILFIFAYLKKSGELTAAGIVSVLGSIGYASLSIFVATEFFFTVSCIFWGVIILAIIGFIVYFTVGHRKQILQKANDIAEDALNSRKAIALDEIHEAVDKAKDLFPVEMGRVLSVLTDTMSKDTKTLIHQMRAERAEKQQSTTA